jgi:hypothetical protein
MDPLVFITTIGLATVAICVFIAALVIEMAKSRIMLQEHYQLEPIRQDHGPRRYKSRYSPPRKRESGVEL